MGHAIPKQHPSVVLRSHFNLVRALLGVAMVALVGLAIALVVVANDDDEVSKSSVQSAPLTPQQAQALPAYPSPEAISPGSASGRTYSGPTPTRKLDGATDSRSSSPVAPDTRYDGGPDEGSRSPLTSRVAPDTRYDGGPEEGSRGPGASTD